MSQLKLQGQMKTWYGMNFKSNAQKNVIDHWLSLCISLYGQAYHYVSRIINEMYNAPSPNKYCTYQQLSEKSGCTKSKILASRLLVFMITVFSTLFSFKTTSLTNGFRQPLLNESAAQLGPVSRSLLKIKVTLNSRISLNFSFLQEISVSQSLLP